MPLTPEQEWTLVACGLVAHADGVLKEGECDQVLAMIDERLSPADQDHWIALVSSREALNAHLEELPPILPLFHEPLLERAWAMALADGEVDEAELEVVERVASLVGADPKDLASWRDAWTATAATLAEHKASFAALLIHCDGTIDDAESIRFQALLKQMPVPEERRREFARMLKKPPSLDHVGARLAALPRDQRVEILRAIAPLVSASQREAVGRDFFLQLAAQAGLDPAAATKILDV
jgi:uncharacterized tellurite resistance protein B-like protein